MAAAALAWLAGIGLQMQQPALWPLVHYLALLFAALLLAAGLVVRLARRAPGSAASLACLCLALALTGFGSTGWRAGQRLAQALPTVAGRA